MSNVERDTNHVMQPSSVTHNHPQHMQPPLITMEEFEVWHESNSFRIPYNDKAIIIKSKSFEKLPDRGEPLPT